MQQDLVGWCRHLRRPVVGSGIMKSDEAYEEPVPACGAAGGVHVSDSHAVSPSGTAQPGGLATGEPSSGPLSSLTFLRQVADEVAVANDDSVEVVATLTRRYLN